MDNSDTNPQDYLNRHVSGLQTESNESAAITNTFFGIPGLGRIGNAPEATDIIAEGNANIQAVQEVERTQDPKTRQDLLNNGAPEDSHMTENGSVQGPVQPTILDAMSSTHAQTTEPMAEVTAQPSQQGDNQGDLDMLQATGEEAMLNEKAVDTEEMEVEISQMAANTEVITNPREAAQNMDTEQIPQVSTQTSGDNPPELTHALEALLGGLSQAPTSNNSAVEDTPTLQPAEEEHPEWEVDSSPIESSSDDSSSDDSSSDDSDEDDDENTYKLLSPEEQARILMEGDGGSDDEAPAKGAKGGGSQLRTKNEIPDEVIPKPDIIITPETHIEELGSVETIVESTVLIKAKTSGEYRVLNQESVLCLADRSVIGVVSETLGRVEQPLYCVRFTNAAAIAEAGLSLGTKVFYSVQHSTYVFTQTLKQYKGSDASNLHDEEVGDEEIEFSDDEAEMEHKRRLKQKKIDRRGGKPQQNGGSSRGGHPLQQQYTPSENTVGLNYDEAEDGPYRPLARPVGFTGVTGGEAPQEGSHYSKPSHRGDRGDHGGRGRGRGRGDRGRGDRGRGRGGSYNDRSNGYSLPPQLHTNNSFAPPNPSPGGMFNSQPPPLPQGRDYSNGYPQSNNSYNNMNQPQYPPQQSQQSQQPQMWPFPQAFPQGYPQTFPQPFANPQNSWGMAPPPPLPSGAFINPAFFGQAGGANQWNHSPAPHNPNDGKS